MQIGKLIAVALCLGWTTPMGAQQKIASINADDLNKRLANKDTIYVVNYWATTCIPCIKEMPILESINKKYKGKKVKVLLLSFDFKEYYPAKLTNYVHKKQYQSEVLWFSEQKPNVYIPKLNDAWEGSLPATTITHKGKNYKWFKEGIITEAGLTSQIDKLLK